MGQGPKTRKTNLRARIKEAVEGEDGFCPPLPFAPYPPTRTTTLLHTHTLLPPPHRGRPSLFPTVASPQASAHGRRRRSLAIIMQPCRSSSRPLLRVLLSLALLGFSAAFVLVPPRLSTGLVNQGALHAASSTRRGMDLLTSMGWREECTRTMCEGDVHHTYMPLTSHPNTQRTTATSLRAGAASQRRHAPCIHATETHPYTQHTTKPQQRRCGQGRLACG